MEYFVPLVPTLLTLAKEIYQWLQSNNKNKKKKEWHELETKINDLEKTLEDLRDYRGHSFSIKKTLNECSEILKENKKIENFNTKLDNVQKKLKGIILEGRKFSHPQQPVYNITYNYNLTIQSSPYQPHQPPMHPQQQLLYQQTMQRHQLPYNPTMQPHQLPYQYTQMVQPPSYPPIMPSLPYQPTMQPHQLHIPKWSSHRHIHQ
ncbi:44643_t:CDS:2 [Gigaspora margarita]|uniref:44643_t:CDS:1 n=1 Tax=Gigaspora margarita TaxID=4874 RepID=A0ABN7VUR1_GIGMA|nr:44643_t:CDS:2 [Gigaspora margarita]